MADWYYLADETVHGPLKSAELLELVRSAEITPATMVRKDQSAWFPAIEVGGLFAAASRLQAVAPEQAVESRHSTADKKQKAETEPSSDSASWQAWAKKLAQRAQDRLGSGPPRPQSS